MVEIKASRQLVATKNQLVCSKPMAQQILTRFDRDKKICNSATKNRLVCGKPIAQQILTRFDPDKKSATLPLAVECIVIFGSNEVNTLWYLCDNAATTVYLCDNASLPCTQIPATSWMSARVLSNKMNNDRADGHCCSFAWI